MASSYVAPRALPFERGSMAWEVNMEPVIALGGGRALLLQVLHPLVAAGVEQHSNFEHDPFRRGFRTADVMLKLAFAKASVSMRQADLLRRIHESVKGTSDDGTPYAAMDPALLLWVWATLVDVSLVMYERAVKPLTSDEREQYYDEQKLIAYACGVPQGTCPETHADFTHYIRDVIDEQLRVTKVARVVAYAGKHPPLPFPLGPLVGRFGSFMTAALLPDRFREALGYAWSPWRERALNTFFFVWRCVARIVPRRVRHLPNRYLIRRKAALGLWRNRAVRLPDELSSA